MFTKKEKPDVPRLLLCRGLLGVGYTETQYAEDGRRRVTSLPEEVRPLTAAYKPRTNVAKAVGPPPGALLLPRLH